MHQLVENIFASKELYGKMLDPVCEKYELSHIDLVILLALANNPQYDTATDIVNYHGLKKSAISQSLRTLEARGLVTGEYLNGNHRSIHLKISDMAKAIVKEGKKAQLGFFDVLMEGFTEVERSELKVYLDRITANIGAYNKKFR